jgi:dTMP kinase
MSARFVTFEGSDGSGKSTHLERCAAWLSRRGLDVRTTREPGGTALGASVRRLFLGGEARAADGAVEALLMFAARRQHLLEVIEPELAAGRHVLCDRFIDSTFVYQGAARGVPLEDLRELDRVATAGRRPDMTVLFDLPAATARERGRSESRQARAEGLNHLDDEEVAFYEVVRRSFLDLAADEPRRFRVVDASGSIEQTERQVRAALEEILP